MCIVHFVAYATFSLLVTALIKDKLCVCYVRPQITIVRLFAASSRIDIAVFSHCWTQPSMLLSGPVSAVSATFNLTECYPSHRHLHLLTSLTLSVHSSAKDSNSVTNVRDPTTALLKHKRRERNVYVQLQVLPTEGPRHQHLHRPVHVRGVL